MAPYHRHPSHLPQRIACAGLARAEGDRLRIAADAAYLLPTTAPTADAFRGVEKAIHEGGGEAHMLVSARDAVQEQAFQASFDRSELYADPLRSLKEARGSIRTSTEAEMRNACGVSTSSFM